jgi:hypothetical protein
MQTTHAFSTGLRLIAHRHIYHKQRIFFASIIHFLNHAITEPAPCTHFLTQLDWFLIQLSTSLRDARRACPVVRCMASVRSSRSRSRARALVGRDIADLVHVVPFDHAAFLRRWLRHLLTSPSVLAGYTYYQLVSEHRFFFWRRVASSCVAVHSRFQRRDVYYRFYAVAWRLSELGDADSAAAWLCQPAACAGDELAACPARSRSRHRVPTGRDVVVLRRRPMALLGTRAFFFQALPVHHTDGVHEHCLLSNLSVEIGSEHVGRHNARR